jgi:predicted ATP-dependent endonuclease of OLD family
VKIESVRIENFRSFKDETIKFDNYTCFVGANGSGKSTVLNALNVFFRQYKDSKTDLSKLTGEDFHHKNTDEPVKITVTFTELSDTAKDELSDYVRQDKLIVSSVAKYDSNTNSADVKQFGNRLGFQDFRKYFDAEKDGEKVAELKLIIFSQRN